MKLACSNSGRRAFSLLEVMIAIAIFFVGSFAVLSLISSTLNNVRRLQMPSVDAGPVLARYAATNILIEGTYDGKLGDDALLGRQYNDYHWETTITEIASNHLYLVDCTITSTAGRREQISRMSTVLYRPQSPPGTLDGAPGIAGH